MRASSQPEALETPLVPFFCSNYDYRSTAYVGTSITAGSGAVGDNGYVRLTDNWLRVTSPLYAMPALANFGMGGSTSWYGLSKVPAVVALAPDVVVVDYAVNDGNVEFHARTEEALIRKLRAGLPNARIIFIAFCSFASGVDDVMTNLNSAVLERWRTICAAYGVTFVDFHAAISAAVSAGGHKVDYMSDTVHPDNGGHLLASQLLRAPLLSLMGGGSMPAVPDRIYDCADFENDPVVTNGVDCTSVTGTWTDSGTDRVSSEANATIRFDGTFASFGISHSVAGVIRWSLDGGAETEINLASYGPFISLTTDIMARGVHYVTIKVVSGTVTIKQFIGI